LVTKSFGGVFSVSHLGRDPEHRSRKFLISAFDHNKHGTYSKFHLMYIQKNSGSNILSKILIIKQLKDEGKLYSIKRP
jgi:hypothetical protein